MLPSVACGSWRGCRSVERAQAWRCASPPALLNGDVERAAEFSRQATVYLRGSRTSSACSFSLVLWMTACSLSCPEMPKKRIESSVRDIVRLALQANNLLVLIIATWEISEMQTVGNSPLRAWATLQKAEYMVVGPNGEPLALGGLGGQAGLWCHPSRTGSAARGPGIPGAGAQGNSGPVADQQSDAMIAQVQLYHARGDIAESQAVLAEASRLALSTESSQWDDTIVSSVAVRLALQGVDLAQAALWWKTGDFPDLAGRSSAGGLSLRHIRASSP